MFLFCFVLILNCLDIFQDYENYSSESVDHDFEIKKTCKDACCSKCWMFPITGLFKIVHFCELAILGSLTCWFVQS